MNSSNNFVLPLEVKYQAKLLAERANEPVGVWAAKSGYGKPYGYVYIAKSKTDTSADRRDIEGFDITDTKGLHDPIQWIDAPDLILSDKFTKKKYKRNLPNIDQMSFIKQEAPQMKIASNKIKMTKDQWLKIGQMQGWTDNSVNMQKKAFWGAALNVVNIGLQAAPLISSLIGGGDEEAGEEMARQNPEQYEQGMQQVTQQAQQSLQTVQPIVKYIQDRANELKAPCANKAPLTSCKNPIKNMDELNRKVVNISSRMRDLLKMNDPQYVCSLLDEAMNLEICSREILKQAGQLGSAMQQAGSTLGTTDLNIA
jgi:hypothetical protein